MSQQDEKVLEELGLYKLPDNEKKAVLAMIDQRLEKRFLANLLMSLDDGKRQTLEAKIDEIEEPKIDDVVRIALDIQPDAPKILADSAGEVMTELKEEKNKSSDVGRQTLDVDSQPTNDLRPTSNDQQPTAEELPPVGANVPAQADNSVPPENNPNPEASAPEPNPPATPYNFDDTARQNSQKGGDYYQP